MPELNPAWEYFAADPEIAEVLCSESVLELYDGEGQLAMRIGKPNSCVMKLGREKRAREPLPNKVCQKCKQLFAPCRSSRLRCERCARQGPLRKLPESRGCLKCGGEFRPNRSRQLYCSPACGGNSGGGCKTVDEAEFSRLYLVGERMAAIAKMLNATKSGLQKVRRRLGLPSRPSGNFSNAKQANT